MTTTPEIAYLYLKTTISVQDEGRFEPLKSADISGCEVAHVITAWNPGDDRPDSRANDAADMRLYDLLVRRGFVPVRARGADPRSIHFEDGWLVRGLRDDEARSIGATFGQVAVFRLANSRQTVLACAGGWSVSRSLYQLSVEEVIAGHHGFDAGGLKTWRWFVASLPHRPDLSKKIDREVLLRFLNRWGCRLPKGTEDSPSPTEQSLEAWWMRWQPELAPISGLELENLSFAQINLIADAFWDLQKRPASSRRTLGPTAASKVLLSLWPETVPAWDRTIANRLYGGTERECFVAHLMSSAVWSAELRNQDRVSELISPQERIGMGKLIDQTLYRLFVRTSSRNVSDSNNYYT